MMLYNVTKPENLFKKLDQMKGQVDLVMPDGATYDWNGNRKLIKSLWTAMPQKAIDRMEVKLHDNRDTTSIIDFMMRGNCA